MIIRMRGGKIRIWGDMIVTSSSAYKVLVRSMGINRVVL